MHNVHLYSKIYIHTTLEQYHTNMVAPLHIRQNIIKANFSIILLNIIRNGQLCVFHSAMFKGKRDTISDRALIFHEHFPIIYEHLVMQN